MDGVVSGRYGKMIDIASRGRGGMIGDVVDLSSRIGRDGGWWMEVYMLMDYIQIFGTFRLLFFLDVGLRASSYRFVCLLSDYLFLPLCRTDGENYL